MSGNGDVPNIEAWMYGPLLSGIVDPVNPQIDLTWTLPDGSSGFPPYDTYYGATGFAIYRADNGGGFTQLATVPITQLTYTDTTLVSTHFYSYYVTPIYADGEKAVSNTITIQGEITDTFLVNSTWVKREGLKSANAFVIGGGQGGQSGALKQGASFGGRGGVGGASGGLSVATYTAAELPASVAVTVGAGGAGGIAPALGTAPPVGNTDGQPGGASAFGSLLSATGGSTVNNYGDTGGTGSTQNGVVGGLGGGSTSDPIAGTSATEAPGAGGGGGAQGNDNGPGVAAAGGVGASAETPVSAAGVAGTAGAPGAGTVGGPGGNGVSANNFVGGGGGGGGDEGVEFTPGDYRGWNGGPGGLYGGGGGGGGCGIASAVSVVPVGSGGAGGPAVVIVKTFFW